MDPTDHKNKALTTAGLNLIAQALSIYDSDLRLAVCNHRFRDMFDLPDHLVAPGARFDDTIRNIAQRGDYGEVGDLDDFVRPRRSSRITWNAPVPMGRPSRSKAPPCRKGGG